MWFTLEDLGAFDQVLQNIKKHVFIKDVKLKTELGSICLQKNYIKYFRKQIPLV